MVTRKRFPPRGGDRNSKVRTAGSRPRSATSDAPTTAPGKIMQAIGKRIPEMRDDLGCYISVQADRARSATSTFRTRLVSGILRTIAGSAMLATATALLVVGTAGGVAAVLEGNRWLANVITGVAVLLIFSIVRAVRIGIRRRGRLRRLQRRYERHAVEGRSHLESGAPHGRRHGE